MKKFVVLLVVVAITCLSAAAFAADISVSGSIDIRSRDFNNTEAVAAGSSATEDNATADGTDRETQERVRLTVDAKAGDVKGRISIENDWDRWGRLEQKQADASTPTVETNTTGSGIGHSILDLREAWINFNIPGIPVNVNAGHQLLQLGNAWFFRDMKYGSDAWVVANVTGANTAAFVDIKVAEGEISQSDDLDAYAFLDVLKLSDTMTVGLDLTNVKDRRAALDSAGFAFGRVVIPGLGIAAPGAFNKINLYNLGLNFNGQMGPMGLKLEIDQQFGKADLTGPVAINGIPVSNPKFKGNQVVLQGNVAMEPASVNFTLARGSGLKTDWGTSGSLDVNQFVSILDADQHYTLLYEYKVPTSALNVPSSSASADHLHTGFANTTALNLGATVAASKSLSVGANLWYLLATDAVAIHNAIDPFSTLPSTSHKLGYEVDLAINWQLYDALSWNWQLGWFKPGAAYDTNDLATGALVSADKVLGAQGVLSYKF
jgi:hypothetical protein